MTEKYYTPDLYEFFVGFEYENKNALGEWIPTVFTLGEYKEYLQWDNEQMFTTHLEQGSMRVKYLDRKDLLSLGFEETEIKNEITKEFKFTRKDEDYFNNGTVLEITLLQKGHVVLEWDTYSSYKTSSGSLQINARNKSNLKRILEDLKF